MLTAFHDKNVKVNTLCLYLLVITVLVGPMIYFGFASLYHFYIAGMLLVILYRGIHTSVLRTDVMVLFLIWLLEAGISLLWAPDKALALKYTYYIFLITGMCMLFHYFLNKDNIDQLIHFFVVVLFVCNLIAFWEMHTDNHIMRNSSLETVILWKERYVPRGFATNPNDFATFIVQLIPFSFACTFATNRTIRILSFLNVVLSFVTICATKSRTQILLLIILYVLFLLFSPKKEIVKATVFAGLLAVVLFFVYPDFNNLIDGALQSIKGGTLVAESTVEGTSLDIRVNLLKNGGYILLDTLGFGIGAGCHRVVMPDYSASFFDTHGIRVMHNLIGEIFVDYGILVGLLFLIAIVRTCCCLYRIHKTNEELNVRRLASMLMFSVGGFVLCGMSSSSIIQNPSLWMTVCFSSAYIRCYRKSNIEM